MFISINLPNQESLKLFEGTPVKHHVVLSKYSESLSSEFMLKPRSSNAPMSLTSWNGGLGSSCLSWQAFIAINQRSGCRQRISFFSTFRNKHLSWGEKHTGGSQDILRIYLFVTENLMHNHAKHSLGSGLVHFGSSWLHFFKPSDLSVFLPEASDVLLISYNYRWTG